jgi:hypothetical protein
MMKVIALVVAAVLLMITAIPTAHADITFDVAVGYNTTMKEGGFQGPRDTARFTLKWAPTESFFVSYTHLSHFSVGWPVNDKKEDYADLLEVGYRFNFNKMF